ncbi:MAG: CatB-related O-acetyltransferase [Paracoccaceae bacterium]
MSATNIIAKTAAVDASARLEAPVRVYGSASIRSDCSIGWFSYLNTRSVLHEGTSVGRYCSIGRDAEIGAWEHPLTRLSTSPVSYGVAVHFPDHADLFPQVPLDRPLTTTIGNDVWIGANVVVRRGVAVGDGAVIGAGAFVTRDVAPYQIVGGTPAHLIRPRFAPDVVAELMALAWWDLDPAVLATVPFDDMDRALAALRAIRGQGAATGGDAVKGAGRSAGTAALQALIDAVPAHPRRAPDAAQQTFAAFLRDKLFDADAPDPLIALLQDEASRLETRYDATDPNAIVALNTKLAHVIEMVTLRPDPQAPLSRDLRQMVLEIMRR